MKWIIFQTPRFLTEPTVKPLKPLSCGFFGVNLLLFANKGQSMTNTKMVIPNQEVQQAAIELLESVEIEGYYIDPETLALIKRLAKGDPMPSTKGNK